MPWNQHDVAFHLGENPINSIATSLKLTKNVLSWIIMDAQFKIQPFDIINKTFSSLFRTFPSADQRAPRPRSYNIRALELSYPIGSMKLYTPLAYARCGGERLRSTNPLILTCHVLTMAAHNLDHLVCQTGNYWQLTTVLRFEILIVLIIID